MKKILLIFLCLVVLGNDAFSQKDSWYTTTGGEMIFSVHNFTNPDVDATVVRWAPVFNMQSMLNKDISRGFGIYTGIAVRNVGFITDDPDSSSIRRKFRTYNVAIPFGIKLGNLDGTFLYAGVDGEYAFNFKEKLFVNGSKEDKNVYWFSNRVNPWQGSVHVGFQFFSGTNIKFKYYLTKFFNEERSVYADEYERFDGNVFYLSFNSNLFYNKRFYYDD